MSFCTKCGHPLEAGAQFCGGCGNNFDEASRAIIKTYVAPSLAPARNSGVVVRPKRAGRLAFWGFLAACLLGAVGGVKHDVMPAIWALCGACIIIVLIRWRKDKKPIVGAGWAWSVGTLLVLASLGGMAGHSTDGSVSPSAARDSSTDWAHLDPVTGQPDRKADQLNAVILGFTWEKGGFDDIMFADFTLRNIASYAVKDVEITCNFFAPSGTKIDSNTRTIYELVPANSTKKVKHFDMGFIHSQAKGASCRVTNLVPVS